MIFFNIGDKCFYYQPSNTCKKNYLFKQRCQTFTLLVVKHGYKLVFLTLGRNLFIYDQILNINVKYIDYFDFLRGGLS